MNQTLIEGIQGMASSQELFWSPPSLSDQYIRIYASFSYSPIQFSLYGKIADGWEIIHELPVTLEQDEDGFYVLSDDLFLIYGEGKTEEEVKTDYMTALIDYYQIIDSKAREGDRLSQMVLQNIQQYLRPIN